MNQKSLFDNVSYGCSRLTTRAYSTSFSIGIRSLGKDLRNPIYAIYGFVRFADEIVDTFHDYPKEELLRRFRRDTELAIQEKISLNPILNSFQEVYHTYQFEWELVDTFLRSMEMDIERHGYDRSGFETYILGSAEVVGLMCLRVFTGGDETKYQELKPFAMRLGAAFQKINFLRDLRADYQELGRTYFPNLNMDSFTEREKRIIEQEIEDDFREAYKGIIRLPKDARFGVYVAYTYYVRLFKKIRSLPSERIMQERIRIPNQKKLALVLKSYVQHNLNLL